VVTVAGRGGRRISIAGLVCYRRGQHGRLIYRMMLHHGRRGEPKGLHEPDFAGLLDAAHQQLGAPIVLVWDQLPGHISAAMRQLISTRKWLRVYELPGYAPDLNPTCRRSRNSQGLGSSNSPGRGPLVWFYLIVGVLVELVRPGRLLGR